MIIRVAKRHRYAVTDRSAVNDSRLSFKARGLLVYLLDKPDNWKIDREFLAKEEVGPDGVTAIRSALQELVQHGYLVRQTRRNERGQIITESWLHEVPPVAENPPSVPVAENRPAVNQPTAGAKTDQRLTRPAVNAPANRKLSSKTETETRASKAMSPAAQGDVEFELGFWPLYPSQNWPARPNPKPGKSKALVQWSRLSRSEKDRALESLPHYKAYLELTGQQTKHCERYLRDRTFDDYQVTPSPVRASVRAGPTPSRNGRNFEAVIQRLGVNDGSETGTAGHEVRQRGLAARRVEPGALRSLG